LYFVDCILFSNFVVVFFIFYFFLRKNLELGEYEGREIWTEGVPAGVKQERKHLQRGKNKTSFHTDLVSLDQDVVESVLGGLFPQNSNIILGKIFP